MYDLSPHAVTEIEESGAKGAQSLPEFVESLTPPRAIWIMLPAAAVDRAIAELKRHLDEGDILIDGGNSYYIDDSVGPPNWRRTALITSMPASAAASGAGSAAIAS